MAEPLYPFLSFFVVRCVKEIWVRTAWKNFDVNCRRLSAGIIDLIPRLDIQLFTTTAAIAAVLPQTFRITLASSNYWPVLTVMNRFLDFVFSNKPNLTMFTYNSGLEMSTEKAFVVGSAASCTKSIFSHSYVDIDLHVPTTEIAAPRVVHTTLSRVFCQ